MTHYVIKGGPFQRAFLAMPREYLLPWQSGGVQAARVQAKAEARYLCPGCGARLGEAGLVPRMRLLSGDPIKPSPREHPGRLRPLS